MEKYCIHQVGSADSMNAPKEQVFLVTKSSAFTSRGYSTVSKAELAFSTWRGPHRPEAIGGLWDVLDSATSSNTSAKVV